jgi:hypothetical protein
MKRDYIAEAIAMDEARTSLRPELNHIRALLCTLQGFMKPEDYEAMKVTHQYPAEDECA